MDPQTGSWAFRDIPFQSPELQYDHHKIRIDVKSPTEAVATDEMSLRGSIAMGLRHVLRNDGQAKRVFETIAGMLFPGTTLRDTRAQATEDTWHPLTVTLDVDASQVIRPQDENFRLTLPGSFKLAGAMALKKRETPLRFGALDSSVYDIETELPDGYQVLHAPKDFTVEHACFTLKRSARASHAPGSERRLDIRIEYARRCNEVKVADYAQFREAVQRAVRNFEDEIVFGKVAVVTPPLTPRRAR